MHTPYTHILHLPVRTMHPTQTAHVVTWRHVMLYDVAHPHADVHPWLAIPVLLLQLVVMLVVSLTAFVVWRSAALLPALLAAVGLHGVAQSVSGWMSDSMLATLAVALPGVTCVWLKCG